MPAAAGGTMVSARTRPGHQLDEEPDMKTILLATDGSDSASEALEFAIELCKETGAALEVLAVRPHPAAGRGGIGPAVLEIESLDGARQIAESAAAQARGVGVSASVHVDHGDPADTIAVVAEALKVDLIVVGSRGLGAISGTLLGSVSRKLAGHTEIPLTIIRERAHVTATV
ncbi:MAG: universal stress protein [Gaiellales bacterium]